jgi:LytS/YehU family sensor histidine kinase
VISKLSFLPTQITKDADKFFHAQTLLRYSFAYVLRELLAISCLAYFIRYTKQEQQMNAIRQEQLQAELKYLKVQLQPHFFFNTLNNIYALTLERSAAAAPLVAKHAEMMRYILYNSSSPKTALADEIAFLENYARVESVRYGEQISISFDKQGIPGPDANIPSLNGRGNKGQSPIAPGDKLQVLIEPLLLLPFVENAFKHGIGDEVNSGYIRIVVCLIGTELILEVMNSKRPGTSPNLISGEGSADRKSAGEEPRRAGHEGIGLKNVEKRLALLYPKKHRLEIKESETDYELRLTLQLNAHG